MQQRPVPDSDAVRNEVQALVTGMAQEIGNPLTVIKTMVYTMSAELPTEDPRRSDFDIVSREVLRMERSIQQFLDYSWPPDPILTPIDLRQVLDRAIEQLAPLAEAQGVQIESSFDLDVTILADQRQIELVFLNLGLNALRVMPIGGKLTIEAQEEQVQVNLALAALPTGAAAAEREAAAKGATDFPRVGVMVGDTGEALAHGHLERVFEPFAFEVGEGSGLSLAIVQQIVTRHGGQIAARERPGGGTTFVVVLPLVKPSGATV